MSNAELIARARKEILPWPQELCVDMCRALEELEAENEGNAADSMRYAGLSVDLYDALHSVAPLAARAILAAHS